MDVDFDEVVVYYAEVLSDVPLDLSLEEMLSQKIAVSDMQI